MHWVSTKKAKAVMLIPTLLVYMVFIIIPVFVAVYYSFTDYSGMGKAEFRGFDNYIRMFGDELFLIALRNTCIVLVCSLLFLLVGSFLTAMLMNRAFRGNAFFKMVVFAPYILSLIHISQELLRPLDIGIYLLRSLRLQMSWNYGSNYWKAMMK